MYKLMINTNLDKKKESISIKSPKKYIEHYYYQDVKSCSKKKHKVSNDDFNILKLNQYNDILSKNHNVSQLKKMCKHYHYKVSGNKPELIKRLYNNMRLSYYAIKVQSLFRSFLVRQLFKMKNMHLYKEATNDIDFLTLEPIKNLNLSQIVCLKSGEKNHVYCFDICSLYNLFKEQFQYAKKNRKNIKKYMSCILNPFNRQPFPSDIHRQINIIVKITKICKMDINVVINNDDYTETLKKTNEFKAIELFQKIDTFGFITDSKWIMELNIYELSKFIKELIDVWDYRAQLTVQTRNNIYPSDLGYPFRVSRSLFNRNIDSIRHVIIKNINKFINAGVDRNAQSLSVFYVLGALTIVSKSAAENLPWLFESFSQL